MLWGRQRGAPRWARRWRGQRGRESFCGFRGRSRAGRGKQARGGGGAAGLNSSDGFARGAGAISDRPVFDPGRVRAGRPAAGSEVRAEALGRSPGFGRVGSQRRRALPRESMALSALTSLGELQTVRDRGGAGARAGSNEALTREINDP